MNIVGRLLLETSASGELDQRLKASYARWDQIWDFGEFRSAVLERVWEHREQFRGQTAAEFLAWLRRVAWSASVDHWRHERRQASLLQKISDFFYARSPPATDLVETRDFVEWILAGLNDGERNLLEMKYFQQKSAVEIARILGMTPSAVRQLHYRAIGKLRKRLTTPDNPPLH
jgi:RNA polymerase sigma-70 factor (ECF subfamily)